MHLTTTIVLLTACAHIPHVDPTSRNIDQEDRSIVALYISCSEPDPFNTDMMTMPGHHGDDIVWHPGVRATGVAISERHVLTAAHNVSCPIIPSIHAVLSTGRAVRMVVTEDDTMFHSGSGPETDLARLEILTADTLDLDIPPPKLANTKTFGPYDRWCAVTLHGRACGTINSDSETMFSAVTRVGDSGAPVYDESGNLVGLVTAGSKNSTVIVPVTQNWLRGT